MKKILIIIFLLFYTNSYAEWTTLKDKDEMTGAKSLYVISAEVGSLKKMSYLFLNTKATLVVSCNNKKKWAYIYFTKEPILNNKTIKNNYNLIRTRIKFDKNVEYTSLIQGWGEKTLFFESYNYIINKIKKSKTLLLELNWYKNGNVYFKFDLNKSSKLISNAFKQCKSL